MFPVIKIVSRRIIRPDCIERFQTLARELARASREEPGCLGYSLNQSREDPRLHAFIECWADQAALDAHGASAHFQRIVPQFAVLTEERPPVEYYRELDA